MKVHMVSDPPSGGEQSTGGSEETLQSDNESDDDESASGSDGEDNSNSSQTSKNEDEDNDEDDEDEDEDCGAGDNNQDCESSDGSQYASGDLPLEVITTVEPTNYAYPFLKNMSNGVLTHRNIFTEQERDVLRNIVEKYRDIVDTRSRTREIYLEKQTVWQQIVEEYNSTDNIMVRTEKELRKCWDNMKYRARQAEKEQSKVGLLKVEVVNKNVSSDQSSMQNLEFQLKMMNGNIQQDEDMKDISGVDVDRGEKEQKSLGNPRSYCRSSDKVDDSSAELCLRVASVKQSIHDSVVKSHNDNNFEGVAIKEEPGERITNSDTEESFSSNLNSVRKDAEDEPLSKKARQESPKLSSILLGTNRKKASKCNGLQYNIPSCTKVTHIKKKKAPMVRNPIPILPKGLSCVSISNIPNYLSTSVAGALAAHNAGIVSQVAPLKPMPNLKKMVSGKKSKSSLPGVESSSQLSNSSNDMATEKTTESALTIKLVKQRLYTELQEHKMRMKILEKELSAQSYQVQYWSLKLKLATGHDKTDSHSYSTANGNLD